MNTPLARIPSPAVTIGIMTRNYARFVGQAIDSVLSQERADWEMVISDDASTDDTAQVVAPYLRDPRIRYVRHDQNLGQAGNWRFLLAQGTAPVVTVLHADDYWLPGALGPALAAFEADPALDLLYGNWRRMVGERLEEGPWKSEAAHRMTGPEEFRYQITRHTWLPSTTFLSRRVIGATGWPNPELRMLVDTEYFLRASLRARFVQALAEPLMVYRVHPANATAEGNAGGLLTAEKERIPAILAAELESFSDLRDCLKPLRRACARSIFSEGVGHVMHDRPAEGRAAMRRALRLDPSLLRSVKVSLDCLLASLGRPSLPLFRRLHSRRLEAREG